MWEAILLVVGKVTHAITSGVKSTKDVDSAKLESQRRVAESVISVATEKQNKKKALIDKQKQDKLIIFTVIGFLIVAVVLIAAVKNNKEQTKN